jgi:hypothetical protein
MEPAALKECWRRHKFLDGLYRFYLGKIISFHTFYLPIAGGVVAYVVTLKGSPAALGLLIPLVVSSGAVWIFFRAVQESEELNAAIRDSAKGLNIISTHAQLLVRTVLAFLILHVMIVIGLVIGMAIIIVYGQIPDLHITSQ